MKRYQANLVESINFLSSNISSNHFHYLKPNSFLQT